MILVATRRRLAILLVAAMAVLGWGAAASAEARRPAPEEVVGTWYRLVLELVRHTPTYSPPVASRTFAYIGVAAYESVASGADDMVSLAGQLNGFESSVAREEGVAYDDAVILHAAIASVTAEMFANTGPTGQRAVAAMTRKVGEAVREGIADDVFVRSDALGRTVAARVLEWATGDGGAVVEHMGFPPDFQLTPGPAHWVPTSTVGQQQVPLLPQWGENRTFLMPDGAACPLPPPPAYSEDAHSEFYKEAYEVYETVNSLTPEQRTIARFWSDDPMLSSTPPGHWISVAMAVLDASQTPIGKRVDLLARLGVVLADSFIACWHAKFEFDLVRPITYIRRLIDPKWEPILITPPFPEYPSGHSTQSGAAAEVLTAFFGEDFAYEDPTHAADGIEPRRYSSFWAAAEEAGISRLYGGIHFRAAIERGLEQGRCVGAYAVALKTRRLQ